MIEHLFYILSEMGRENNTYMTFLPEGVKLNGRYIVGKVIGKGGFGIVYEAFDIQKNCMVAVKEFFVEDCMVRDRNGVLQAISSEDESAFIKIKKGRDHVKLYEEKP